MSALYYFTIQSWIFKTQCQFNHILKKF